MKTSIASIGAPTQRRGVESASVGADLDEARLVSAGRPQRARHRVGSASAWTRDKKTEPHRVGRRGDNLRADSPQNIEKIGPPSFKRDRLEHDVARSAID